MKVVASEYHPALTGIRAIAAWMVFGHHFIPVSASSHPLLYNLAFELQAGVSIFFVLSGFLIFYRYQSRTREGNWIGPYLRNRVARIFPLLFILTVVTYVFAGPRTETEIGILQAFLLNITLLNGYSDSLKFMGIAQAWTLTVEETFYLLAPLIMLVRSKTQLIIVPLIALLAGFLLVLMSRNSEYFFGDDRFMLTYTFFGRCTEFCSGVFLAMIFKNKEKLQGIRYTSIGVQLTIATMTAMAFLHGNDPKSVLSYPEIAVNNVILPLSIAIFFYGLLREHSWVSSILSGRFFQLFGKSSYAFYLVHIGVIQVFLTTKVTGNPIFLFILLNAIAVALYYGLERPLNYLIRTKER